MKKVSEENDSELVKLYYSPNYKEEIPRPYVLFRQLVLLVFRAFTRSLLAARSANCAHDTHGNTETEMPSSCFIRTVWWIFSTHTVCKCLEWSHWTFTYITLFLSSSDMCHTACTWSERNIYYTRTSTTFSPTCIHFPLFNSTRHHIALVSNGGLKTWHAEKTGDSMFRDTNSFQQILAVFCALIIAKLVLQCACAHQKHWKNNDFVLLHTMYAISNIFCFANILKCESWWYYK